jgi:cysteine desulfurase
MTSNRIYLDYAATTPVDPDVVAAMLPFFSSTWGNSSSIHAAGRASKAALEQSRLTIAEGVGADPLEIIFTNGGTEADNHALKGLAFAVRKKTGRFHILVSAIEHHAVLKSAEVLREHGFSVGLIPVDAAGRIRVEELERLLTPETGVVAVMHANNEIGTIQPIAEIVRCVHDHQAFLHMDAVQTLGKIPLDLHALGVDTAALSAHKIYGPKGIGALYIRKGVEVDALIHGGAQERNRRGGTENVPLIVGFAAAVRKSNALREHTHVAAKALGKRLRAKLAERWKFVFFNGDGAELLPHIVSISFDGKAVSFDGESMLMNLDLRGIAASSGSACSSGSLKISHVIKAIGRDEATARATLRFSFGRGTTLEEIDALVAALESMIDVHEK